MNELALIDKIEERLQERKDIVVFPLTPTHRKELRLLRDRNIGELRSRLRTIKDLKKEEYTKKYKKQIGKELDRHKGLIKGLNDDWKKISNKIKALLQKRVHDEKKVEDTLKMFDRYVDYGSVANLQIHDIKLKREFSIDVEKNAKKIAEKEFEEKFGESFEKSQEHIDNLHTMYEEAINFGDLEIVKEIYYKLKNADAYFTKVAELKV